MKDKMIQNQIFSNLTILDISTVLAAPSVAMFFAELGAKVIKIENPNTQGDVTRKWKLKDEDASKNDSSYYASINYGKDVRFLDVKNPNENLEALIKKADILISNIKKESLKDCHIGFERLTSLKPDIIFAHLRSYPHNTNKAAYDVVMQAETGFLSMTGQPDALAKLPVALIDVLAAHQLKEAILVALYRKAMSGQGSYVEVSLYESAITGLVNQAAGYLEIGKTPKPMGTAHPNIAPYGDIFTSKDHVSFVLAVVNDTQFEAITQLLDNSIWEAFNTNTKRLQKRKSLQNKLQLFFDQWYWAPLSDALTEQNIPFGQIQTVAQVLDKPSNKDLFLDVNLSKTYKVVRSVAFRFIK